MNIILHDTFLYYSGYPLAHYSYHFIMSIEACRLWLISYDLHYLRSSKQWKSQIDASFAEHDWYLHHRGTFGNKHYILRGVVKYYFFAATTSTIASVSCLLFDDHYLFLAQFVDSSLFALPLLTVLFTYWKVRNPSMPIHESSQSVFTIRIIIICILHIVTLSDAQEPE